MMTMESTIQLKQQIIEMNISKKEAFLNLKLYKKENKDRASLRGQHQLLARYLINFFIEEWNSRTIEERQKGFFLFSNNSSLSQLCDCSVRSIRNQIKRLIEFGLLEGSERTKRGIQVWINPHSIIDFSSPDKKEIQGLVLEPSVKEERTINVDSLATQRTDEKNTEEQHSTGSVYDHSWFLMKDPVCCSDLAKNFWRHAKKCIYPELEVAPNREKAIIDLIERNFKIQYTGWKGELVDLYFKSLAYLERVREWFKDHGDVFPPDPYHFFSNEKEGFRFWKLERIDHRKTRAKQIQLVRRRIRLECLRFAQGLINTTKIELLTRHLKWIDSNQNLQLSEWFLSKSHKLYSL